MEEHGPPLEDTWNALEGILGGGILPRGSLEDTGPSLGDTWRALETTRKKKNRRNAPELSERRPRWPWKALGGPGRPWKVWRGLEGLGEPERARALEDLGHFTQLRRSIT